MPKQVIKDKIWENRIQDADKHYKAWENDFKVPILEKYYEGTQWKSQAQLGYNPYVINKVYETIQIKLADFVPTYPSFLISAEPKNSTDDLEEASKAAQLKQDVLNTVVQDKRKHFAKELKKSYRDSYFRFGILEVGYSADWIMNPNITRPLLGKDTDHTLSSAKDKQRVKQEPEEVPVNERVFFKHISARRFRVGGIENQYLEDCGWFGYYFFVLKDDLLARPNLMNRTKVENLQAHRFTRHEEQDNIDVSDNLDVFRGDAVKIWHLWDNRSNLELLVVNDPTVTVWQKTFKRIPIFDYRPDLRQTKESWYPVPSVYHWLSCQDEINETRQQLRVHRSRFTRKFQILEDSVDDEEISKFESGPDGTIVKTKVAGAIQPINNADLGAALSEAVQTSADDFNRITGTPDQMRGVSDRGTATEAKLINNSATIRENSERDQIDSWLSDIGRESLNVVKEKFTLGFMVRLTSPEGEHFLGSASEAGATWKWITSDDLVDDKYDLKINVDVTSLSVTAQADAKQKFLEFLSVLTQFPAISLSPTLVREAAIRVGYRNEKAIGEFQKMALLAQSAALTKLQGAAGGGAQPGQPGTPGQGPAAQQIAASMTPPNAEQIRNQLTNQLGVTQ